MKQRSSGSKPGGHETGFTLVEMMVSLAVLSVVLAATAASLITFTRASVDNERRLQATAYLNNLHEELQAVPWPEAELYADEAAAALPAVGADFSTTPTFEGQPIAMREGPGCLPLPDCRVEVIPFAYEADVLNADGRTYDVYRIITDVSRGGTAERDVKRFTTIVRWESLGETVEQRFDSERAPTPEEYAAANVPEVTQFLITPAEIQLDEDGEAMQSMSIVARFRDEVVGASLHLPDGTTSIPLTRDGTSNRFTGSVPAGGHVFVDGEQPFEVRGAYDAVAYASDTTIINFLEYHEDAVLPPPPPVVNSVVVDQYSYTVARYSAGSEAFQLCSPLTVRVRVSGLEPGVDGAPTNGSVTAYYEAGSPQGAGLVGPATITGTDDEFLLVFPAGTKSPWKPAARSGSTPPATIVDAFTVAANNDGGPQSDLVTSSEVQFTGSDQSNGKC